MNWLDITLLCLAGVGFVKGLFDGFVKQVASLIALAVGIYFCGEAADWVRGYILATGWFPEEGITILSYIAGFLLIVGLMLLVGEVINRVIDVTPLSIANHATGGFFGLFVTLLFASLFLNLLEYVDRGGVFISRQSKVESRFYNVVREVLPTIYPQSLFTKGANE